MRMRACWVVVVVSWLCCLPRLAFADDVPIPSGGDLIKAGVVLLLLVVCGITAIFALIKGVYRVVAAKQQRREQAAALELPTARVITNTDRDKPS